MLTKKVGIPLAGRISNFLVNWQKGHSVIKFEIPSKCDCMRNRGGRAHVNANVYL